MLNRCESSTPRRHIAQRRTGGAFLIFKMAKEKEEKALSWGANDKAAESTATAAPLRARRRSTLPQVSSP
jgi:hypothetical protein